MRGEPSCEETFSFYGRLDLCLRGPAAFAAEVAEYFWPQVRPAVPDPGAIMIEVLVGGMTTRALAALPRRPVPLYRSPDGAIPDWNDGIGYTAPWGVDQLIVNPHTGSQIVVTGRHMRVLNPRLDLGIRDAIRVIKQLVTTTLEAEGAVVMHAAAFALDGGAVALVGGKGAGKTTTVLAAVASGATLISNDRLYAWPSGSQTTVVGWTDPIRVIGAAPEAPKRVIPLIQYAHGDRRQVIEQPLPLAAVVVPDVHPGPCRLACVELDDASGDAALRAEVLPQRVRWLGLEPDPRPPAASPTAPRYLRLSYAYQDAHLAATTLRAKLRDPR
ncbi:MAG: hypothetical protein JO115_04130 [Pseudonocardiales bacterium]|nr:hypothetical protein [Pseudonocardiales bacterium]